MNAAGGGTDRTRLYEVEMSLFVHKSGKNPNDLRAVHAENVSEEGTMAVLARTRATRERLNRENEGKEGWTPLDLDSYSVNRSSAGADGEAFKDFMENSAFGRSSTKLPNTPGFNKQVTHIEVGPGAGGDDDSNVGYFFS